MSELPKWYKRWVPRVSSVVEFVYPFEWFAKENYEKWLKENNIDEDEYLTTAQDWWTFIHEQLEFRMLWKKLSKNKLSKLHSEELKWWIAYVDNLKKKYPEITWSPEEVVRDKENRFQWTIDLVRVNEKTKTVWLYDYKSWWIVKKKYWLEDTLLKSWVPPRPSSKLKKLALQLSLYAQTYIQKWYNIWWLYWVWVHKTWTYEYEVPTWSTQELDKLLEVFSLTLDGLNFKINDMFEIEILEPTKQYWNVKVKFKLDELDNWKTSLENIKQACKTAKALANEMK